MNTRTVDGPAAVSSPAYDMASQASGSRSVGAGPRQVAAGRSIDAPSDSLPILKTKLFIPPPRREVIPRPRLTSLVAGRAPLTLISAPAGFGKTTLLAEWAECARTVGGRRGHAPPTIAWLSLDDGDNDLQRFLAYVVAAIGQAAPGLVGDAKVLLSSAKPSPPEAVLTRLINTAATWPRPLILVLDDYHVISAMAIHQALRFLVQHLPQQFHLVLATRVDPPLPLARLRARDQLVEIRADDLRFTSQEARVFLNQAMGLDISTADIAALERRIEGWAVGLQMVALWLQGRQPDNFSYLISAFTGSHRYVLDYLTDEVLEQQGEPVRRFLLRTAIVDRLTASLCDAITAEQGSQEMLERLDAANLFIFPLDEERRWYRYHHLFADLLRKRLRETEPELLPTLHRRASAWYERQGLIAQAVGHALTVDDIALAARLIGTNALAMVEHTELPTLERLLDSLPAETVHGYPWLCVAHAWVLAFTGQLEAIAPLLHEAEQGATGNGSTPADQRLLGHIICIRAYVAGVLGDTRQALELSRLALACLPADDLVTRAWATVSVGLNLYRCGDIVEAYEALAEGAAIGRALGGSYIAVMALSNQGAVLLSLGRLRRAAQAFRDALELTEEYAERAGRRLAVSGYAHTYLAALLLEWNELDAALSHAQEGIALCRQWGEPQLLTGGYMRLAEVLQATGDRAGALEAIAHAKQAAGSLSPWYFARVAPLEALISLRQGDVDAASRWVAAQKARPDAALEGANRWILCLTEARVHVARGCAAEALAVLTRLQAEEVDLVGQFLLISVLVVQALALQAQRQMEQALATLGQALALAEPEGYMRIFLDEGPPMAALLRSAVARGVALDYASRLVAAFGEETIAEPVLLEPFTERELEVLRLLAAGLSNRAAAEQLFLAVGTVKKYTNNIYGKLGVGSRTQAVARARELGLI